MKRTQHLRKLSLLVFLFIGAGIVSALTLNSVAPTWSDPVGSSGPATCVSMQTVGAEAQIRFGDDDFVDGCPSDASLQSGFGFEGSTGITFTSGTPFVLGELTHYNNPIFASSLLQSVNLNLALAFGDPAHTDTYTTTVTLDETANNLNTCPYGGAQPCADQVSIERQAYEFTVDETDYQFEILGLIPGTPGSCVYNETQISNQFISSENAANSACLFGRLTAVENLALEITKAANVTSAAPGTVIDYQIDYTCASTTESCRGVVLTDYLPNELTYIGSTGSTHTIQTAGVYSAGNHSVRFNFIDPLPAGSTGYVRIRAQVRSDGTIADGEPIDNTAISTLTNGKTTTTTHSIPTVAVSNWNVVKTAPTHVFLDTDAPVTDTTYTVGICSEGSTVNLLNAQMVDTLPEGAVFVSATGAHTYDAAAGTITWALGDLNASSGCTNRQVTVRFPNPPFSLAQNVLNSVDASGEPVGEPPWTDTASVTNPLEQLVPTPQATLQKFSDRMSYIVGAIAQFRLHPVNTGNVPLQNFRVTDVFPPQMELDRLTVGAYTNFSGGQVIIRYQRSDNVGTWLDWPESPFTTNQTLNVSSLGLPGGVYVAAVQWNYGTVQPGFQPSSAAQRPRVYARIISPDHAGNEVSDGASITNNATLDWDYPPGGISGSSSGGATLLIDTLPSPEFDKTSQGGVSAAWRFLIDEQVGYYSLNTINSSGVALDTFTVTDSIPPQFNVSAITLGQYTSFGGGQVTVRYQTNTSGGWVTWGTYTPSNQTLSVSSLGLPGGTYITQVQWDYGTIPVDFASSAPPRIHGSVMNPDRTGALVNENDVITNTAVAAWTYEEIDSSLRDTTNDVIRQPVAQASPSKSTTTTGPYIPSSIVGYSLRVAADSTSPSVLRNPIVMDLLPADLLYVPNSWAFNPGSSGAAQPTFEVIENYNDTGRTLLRWRFNSPFAQGQSGTITFQAAIGPGAAIGTLTNQYFITSNSLPIINGTPDTNDLDGDGSTTDILNGASNVITVDQLIGLDSIKGVRGELDTSFSYYPAVGHTIPNGDVVYRLSIINEGNIPIRNVRVVDILPFVGDTGVQDTRPRGSEWSPRLTGLVAAPANVTVYYSTSGNPCRPEIVTSGPAGCTPANWSTLPPANIASVRSLRFDFSDVLQPGQSFNFTWTMQAPPNALEGSIAWNSFAFTSTNATTGYPLRPAEPNKVGIRIENPEYAPLIELVKSTNGEDANFAPGPLVPVGDPVTWTYTITNTGNTRLGSVSLTDDVLGAITCQEGAIPDLEIGDSFTCTVTDSAPGAIIGQYANIGTVVATPIDASGDPLIDPDTGNPLPNVDDTDPSHYYGYDPDLARLGDTVWIDENGDGLQTGGEPGLPGVTVRLLAADGTTLLRTTTTDGNGHYAFVDLEPDTYVIQFMPPGVYLFTTQNAGDDTLDSDADVTTSKTEAIVLGAGESNQTIDAGVIALASIGDRVWRDTNDNGIQDSGEAGFPGVTVRLLDGSGTLLDSTQTDDDGIYRFVDRVPGSYMIEVVAPTGYTYSRQDQGSDDALDSDVSRATGRTAATLLTPGENDPTWDAGLVQVASIGNFVWSDSDADGVQDSGEPGVAGVNVSLYDSANTLISSTTTNGSGNYTFTNLAPGDYYLVFGLPAGYIRSSQDVGGNTSGSDTTDSDASTSNGQTIVTSLAPNENDMTWDAGLIPLASIGDRVWRDLNNNGLQDGGETGFPGITVHLLDSSFTIVATTTTNGVGNYLFDDLTPGQYAIEVERPADYVFSPLNAGNDSLDSDVNRATGRTPLTTLSPGEDDLTWDAGLVEDAEIGDYVWYDENNNGLQDSGEPDAANVTVRLLDSGGTVMATTLTDASGFYMFTNLTPAQYALEFVMPTGYVPARRDVGGDDSVDSDPDRFTYRTVTTTLDPGETDDHWDMGLVLSASIGDRVWRDTNGNGIQDGGEPGVQNVTVRLLNSVNTVIATDTTDANGLYGFDNLPPDDYRIEVVLPATYVFSLPNQGGDSAIDSDVDITTGRTPLTTLDPDEDDLSWDAGLIPSASIGDRVWRDNNGNGIQDGGEPGIQNVTVRLYTSGGALLGTTTTNASGIYAFTTLRPGDYYLQFVTPTGYTRSPQNQGGDDAVDSDASTTSGSTDVTTLDPDEHDTTWDAGFAPLASIGNRVWRDINNNGVQDGGETGIQNVTVQLYDSTNALMGTTTTNASGIYGFSNLVQGDYYLVFGLPTGYMRSLQNVGSDATDSDADPSTGQTASTTLTWGENDDTWDAGLVPLAAIGNLVWHDLNDNGIQDGGELGVQNVTIRLYNSANTLVNTTTSGAGGVYAFTNLVPGDYSLEFVLPGAQYVFSRIDQGGNDNVDSDANTTTGRTALTTLTPGETDNSWDAGIMLRASIGDRVWEDTNDNGVQDGGETGYSGVTVTLYNQGGTAVATDVTDSDGLYGFTDLVPGTYSIGFTLPTGYVFSRVDQGGNDALDSDADRTTGRTPNTHLTSGENDLTWDAGIMQVASIGNFVWNDANDNGVQDGGENGIQNVTVRLYAPSNTLIATTTTDASGFYSFTNVTPGDYYVNVTAPAGYVFSRQNVGDDTLDSDVNRTTGNTATTTLSPGEHDMTWDAGLMQVASIGNFVWHDANDNGVQDNGEPGIGNVTVRLYAPPSTLIATTTTDANGMYTFTQLVPDDYYLVFTLPTGYVFSRQNVGDDTTDSDADRVTGRTATTTLMPGENDLTWDAGMMQVASIGNFVWNDANDNGIQDGGENGHSGVTVSLYDGTGTLVDTTVTDANGAYSFTNLVPGDYSLDFGLPAGYVFSRQNQGSDDTLDSDADRATGETIVTTLLPGENDTSWDAGIMQVASIGNYVWNDANDNGVQDGAESGIAGILVRLYDANDDSVPLSSFTTTATGLYQFTSLVPGDYYVEFVLPSADYAFSRQDMGGDDTLDSDVIRSAENAAQPAKQTTGRTITTTLLPGENDLTWDAGVMERASIGDRVWYDGGSENGIQDGGENGVGSIEVQLYDGADTLIATTTTDVNGTYTFTQLVPGDYYVVFTLPDATTVFTVPNAGGDDTADSDVSRSAGQTSGRTPTTTLLPGEDDLTWDAGLTEIASIGDRVWNDSNDNGLQDNGENGVGSVTVRLYDDTDTLIDTTTTDSSGLYSFTGLFPGNYYLVFELPANRVFSRIDQGSDDALDSDADRTTGQTATTFLTAGENDQSWDAGIMDVVSIGDRVWNDANDNGIQDNGEAGIGNVTVRFYDSSDTLIDTTTTDANGFYSFVSLVPDDYYLVFELPTGYVFSRQNLGGDDALDSDADRTTGATAITNLQPGEHDMTWDAGMMQVAGIGDRVWNDANDDGIQTPGENGYPLLLVSLYDGDDNPITSMMTDASGNYFFGGLVPGDYYVHFTLPGGYVFSRQDVGANDALDSDVDRATGRTVTTTLMPGEIDATWDAGVMLLASIGDRVWNDSNDNGIQDGGENGYSGVTVSLYDGTGTLVDTTFTDANGAYSFTNLVPGDYSLDFGLPAGYVFSRQNQGGDDTLDSDADRATGETVVTTLLPGENDIAWDAGVMQVASLGDFVWSDTNANGVQDGGEPGLPNVTVTLYDGANTLIGTTTTDANGAYSFTSLVPGDYSVVFTLPATYHFSPLDAGTDTDDSDADTATGATITTTLLPGEDDLTWDAGMYQLASLGDWVWDDLNADGVQDSGEPGLGGVTVTLYDGTDTQVAQTTTDGSGFYHFNDLVPGDYYVVFTLPAGFIFSPENTSAEATDSDASVTTGATDTTTLISGENDQTWDAGMYRTTALGNRVWDDLNADGIQDTGEPGVEGVTVTLYDGTNSVVDSTSTDADGGYLFTELVPGDYYVVFTLPADYLFSPADAGADDAADSDADPVSGQTIPTNLISNEVDLTWDAGIYQRASIGNRVWSDTNADGVQDTDEPGMPDIAVTLYDGSGSTLDTTTTDADGFYSFTDLEPGEYQVGFALPVGYAFTEQDAGGSANDDDRDSDPDFDTGLTAITTLISGENDLSWDAGLALQGSLGDRVWEDLNYNGMQDSGERGLPNIGVALLDGNGAIIDTTTTDGDGLYRFIHLDAGDYALQFTLPDGYTFSPRDAGANDADSDADEDTGRTAITALEWGEDDVTWDAGIVQLGALGDRVWLDANRNGQQDADEVGIAGVTLTLDGLLTGPETTLTDASGTYLFDELPPGDYTITVAVNTLPNGLEATYDLDGSLDSVTTVTLTAGEENLTVDFGYARPVAAPTDAPTACPRACTDWILYHTDRTGDWEIFRLGGDMGSQSINLSQGDDAEDIAPSRSPNAEWIVFASNRDGNWELYLAPTDGTSAGIRRLTYNTVAKDTNPVWGPNNYVVFETTRNGNWDLYLMDMATGHTRQLTDDTASDVNASWSPDGRRIVFQSDRSGQWQIYALDLVTMRTTLLSDGQGADFDPQYSNAGDRIAFRSYRDSADDTSSTNGINGVIYTMRANGSDVRRISDAAGDAANHIWSPTDALIAYQSNLDGDLDIYVYDVGSGTTRKVTDNAIPDYAPMWRCDTDSLLFTSDVSGNPDIYDTEALPISAPAIDVLKDAEQLTNDLAQDIYPLDAPAEEIASREGRLPGTDTVPPTQTEFLIPDVTTTDIDLSLENSRVLEQPINGCPEDCDGCHLNLGGFGETNGTNGTSGG